MAGAARRILTNSQPLPLTVLRGAAPRSGLLARLTALWDRWYYRMSVRGELVKLSDRDLYDIGLTREAIFEEISKPFWRG